MKKLLILLITLSSVIMAKTLPSNSIVKIHVSSSYPNYKQPWQTSNRIQITGSGVIIDDEYIITNAHVVDNSKFVQVSKGINSKKYTATIEFISSQADLALLKVKDKEFYIDTVPLKFTDEVKTGDNVTTLGFPLGGNSLSTTKGIVSRIEQIQYAYSYEYMLGIQIDAAINSGNSGGAAIDDDNNVIGIVMQSYLKDKSDNIGYIIPSVIVKTFLDDIKDGKVDGYDNSKTYYTNLTNPSRKEFYNIKDNQGVVLSNIQKNEDTLQLGDIILEIDGHKISNDGKVETQYGTQSINFYKHLKPVGQTISFKLRRDNKILDLKYKLKRKDDVVYYEYSKTPRYIIFGGLVFVPLNKNGLNAHNIFNAKLFEKFYELKDRAQGIEEGVMILQSKFDHDVNEGYNPYLTLVHTVNGEKVKNFKHLVKLLDKSDDKFTIIDFIDLEYEKIIFKTKEARDSFYEIKNIYGLSTDRRIK